MNCPKCGRKITKRRNRCEVCGQDISTYTRLERISNAYYNKGLEEGGQTANFTINITVKKRQISFSSVLKRVVSYTNGTLL